MDEVRFPPGWLRRDVARAGKRMDEWAGGTGMERLSDERLRELIDFVDNDVSAQYASDWAGNNFLCQDDEDRWDMVSEVSKALNELLELRAKLAAGPVMPEVPSDTAWGRLSKDVFDLIHGGLWTCSSVYEAIRTVLLKEQSR